MSTTQKAWDNLKKHFQDLVDMEGIASLLNWDQSVYMPAGGAVARGRQMALVETQYHTKLTDPRVGEWLSVLESERQALPADSNDACFFDIVKFKYDRARRVPLELRERQAKLFAESYNVWIKARPANDFKATQPYLEQNLALNREIAAIFSEYQHPLDVLIDEGDRGMTVAQVRPLFAELKNELVPLIKAIAAKPVIDDSCLQRHFADQDQWTFGEMVAKKIGYNFECGRQDKTHHPFMTKIGAGDWRITTRVFEDNLVPALFGTIHETGHALYEQGVSPDLEGTPLASGTSMGVHESQSRLWENLVGRSKPFWQHFYPQLQSQFSKSLGDVSLEQFYRAINKVQPSLIRVEADEVTYNLHVMIRFELEASMLEGKLAVKDLPEAWNAAYKDSLGVVSPTLADGVMQDVHWYGGSVGGYFQSYTLGNIMSAQFFDAAHKAHPDLQEQFARGEFGALLKWLRANIHQHGAKFPTREILKRATGQDITVKPFVSYLKKKYGEIYGL